MFKVVFIDFWKTLVVPKVDENEYFKFRAKCLNDVLSAFGYNFDDDKVFSAHLSSRRVCDNIRELSLIEVPLDLELRIFLSLLNIFDREPKFMNKLRAAYMSPLFNLTSPVNGALDFLVKVRDLGLKIGLISNVYTDVEVIDILRSYGFHDYLDSLTLSCVVGFRKPRNEIFISAMNSLGVHPEEAIMIGDDFDTDIFGAMSIGMKAIWFTSDDKFQYEWKACDFKSIFNILLSLVH